MILCMKTNPSQIIDESTNLCNYFRKGKILGEINVDEDLEDMVSGLKRGECLTKYTYW